MAVNAIISSSPSNRGEVTPELALEIAKEFAAEYLADYEVVIGTHVDKGHIHSHLVFNSVNAQTGGKYHITTQDC